MTDIQVRIWMKKIFGFWKILPDSQVLVFCKIHEKKSLWAEKALVMGPVHVTGKEHAKHHTHFVCKASWPFCVSGREVGWGRAFLPCCAPPSLRGIWPNYTGTGTVTPPPPHPPVGRKKLDSLYDIPETVRKFQRISPGQIFRLIYFFPIFYQVAK